MFNTTCFQGKRALNCIADATCGAEPVPVLAVSSTRSPPVNPRPDWLLCLAPPQLGVKARFDRASGGPERWEEESPSIVTMWNSRHWCLGSWVSLDTAQM